MSKFTRQVMAAFLIFFAQSVFAQNVAQKAKDLTCQGKFINPITDICWTCMLPIKIAGGMTLMQDGNQEDYDSMEGGQRTFCACGNGLESKAGVTMSFWEPTHLVETVRHPFCMVSLGGSNWGKKFNDKVTGNPSLAKWFGGSHKEDEIQLTGNTTSFYQAHWYKNPAVYWLQVILDNDCLDKGAFDIGWLTELDPTWKSPELAFLQAPDAALFANPIAQAVCAADCIKANTGFPYKRLFWCAGCAGSVYPYTGYIANQVSPVQAAKLMVARIQSKMHRDFVAHTATGSKGLCGFRLQPVMDKRQYKMSMTYPVAARKYKGKCCEPIGRTTLIQDTGKSFPYKGQDFAYQVYRKRDCCGGYKYD
jgi:conjugal transfer pilus assembly protein TraU